MSDIMMEGFNLALYGMGFVFVFLLLLVCITVAMSSVVMRFAPAIVVPPRRRSPQRTKRTDENDRTRPDDKRVVAAISAAIRQHRSRNDSE